MAGPSPQFAPSKTPLNLVPFHTGPKFLWISNDSAGHRELTEGWRTSLRATTVRRCGTGESWFDLFCPTLAEQFGHGFMPVRFRPLQRGFASPVFRINVRSVVEKPADNLQVSGFRCGY